MFDIIFVDDIIIFKLLLRVRLNFLHAYVKLKRQHYNFHIKILFFFSEN